MEAQYYSTVAQVKAGVSNQRVDALDSARGLIMIMMALCHTRDYIGAGGYENLHWHMSPAWNGRMGIDVLQQLFSVMVPGGFFMLMGIGIVFFYRSRLKSGWPPARIRRYLLVRGLVLVTLQLTVLQLFEIMAEQSLYFFMGVLFALGCCMMVASCVEYLSQRMTSPFLLPVLLIVAITIPQQLYINSLQNQHLNASLWQDLLLLCGVSYHGIKIDIDFTPLPWIPGVMLGLVIGHLMLKYKQRSMKIIGKTAVFFLATVAILTALNFSLGIKVGDYRDYGSLAQTSVLSWLCFSKYPPSINYYLFSCGISLALIYLFSLCEHRATLRSLLSPVKTIGQCALFFYVLHWFVYYGLSLITPTEGFSQSEVLATWLLGILLLYPLCKIFLRFKQSQAPESLWRLF
ncbi:heparan-alpha-glucosaminide N-acetyltransferase domain-containing protein [Legionella sp. CNM-4043-24]|uniref:heparan-alpha-glucosaminide N-acetyltransferase domain-containing protein n=1 Tax=Legionella sp. CNM-4043-24 TaxID=3421646 RepID=UPI00403A7E56